MGRCGVKDDGTLWSGVYLRSAPPGRKSPAEWEQIGEDTNWATVAMSRLGLVALKSDGSLWKWDRIYSQERRMWVLAETPGAALGTHHDWVGLGSGMGEVFSLAADGSLWLWPPENSYDQPLLAPSKKPSKITNIFGD